MASIKFDTELLVNQIPIAPVAAHTKFEALLHPTTRRSVVLGLRQKDNRGDLELITEDVQGHRHLVNFSRDKLGIPEGTVQAFAARQDDQLSIYLVVAHRFSDTVSNVTVVKPFSLSNLDSLKIYNQAQVSHIDSFFMSPVVEAGQWPFIVIAHQRLDRFSGGSDISQILVQNNSLQVIESFKMPENATSILDVCAASNNVWGSGIWVLYKIAGQTALLGQFASIDENSRIQYQYVQPNCPNGASCIEPFVDADGDISIAIGAARGLFILTSATGVADRAEAKLVVEDPIFKSPSRMQIAQDGSFLTVWSVGKDGVLGYVKSTIDQIGSSSPKQAIILMSKGTSSQFATTISQPAPHAGLAVLAQSIVSNDDFGNLSLLTQNIDTGLWITEPFAISDIAEVMEVPSYSITATALDSLNRPISGGTITVLADSTLQAWVNGKPTTVSSLGSDLPLDIHGELNLIVATDSVAGKALRLRNVRDAKQKVVSDTITTIDPTAKVMQAFAVIKTDTDLTQIKTKSGQFLYGSGDQKPSADDLKAASQCFQQLTNCHNNLQVKPTTQSNGVHAASNNNSSDDMLMEGWNWIKEKWHDVLEWGVRIVDGVANFFCKLAGEIKHFVLDCVEKIGAAVSWVWSKIKLGFNKLIDFAGFLFMWDDIKETKNTISSLLTATLDYGSMKIESLETTVDSFFTKIESSFNQSSAAKQVPASSQNSQDWKNTSSGAALDSTAFKWMGERIKNGGAATGMTMSNTTTPGLFNNEPALPQIFEPIGDSITKLFNDISQDIVKLFHDGKSFTNNDLWAKLGKDFAKNTLEILKKVIISILKLADKLIINLNKLGNAPIKIPVITPLWKKISGHDLTLFDAVSMILGFMVCIITKLLTGHKPPTFAKLDAMFIDRLINGQASHDEKRDLALFFSALSMNVAILTNIVSLVKFAYNMVVEGTDSAVKSLSPSTSMTIISSLFGILGLVAAYPSDPGIPGYEIRRSIVFLGLGTTAGGLILTLSPLGGKEAEKKLAVFQAIAGLIEFGLYDATYALELLPNSKYEGKDNALSGLGIAENVFSTISKGGKSTAIISNGKDEEIAAIALAVMQIAGAGLTLNKGVTLARVASIFPTSSPGVGGAF